MSAVSTDLPENEFESHVLRGRFNAAFFQAMDPYLDATLRGPKRRVFAQLPRRVVEIGPGAGANLRYMAPHTVLAAIEPNPYMHERLRAAARRRGIRLELRESMAEHTGLADHSEDAVISSLVLCSVADPGAALAEIRRILRPGGTFRFVEHVVAPEGTSTRAVQRMLRRPWAWAFEGCSCERDLERVIRVSGFARVEIQRYRVHTPFIPFNTQIAGVATA